MNLARRTLQPRKISDARAETGAICTPPAALRRTLTVTIIPVTFASGAAAPAAGSLGGPFAGAFPLRETSEKLPGPFSGAFSLGKTSEELPGPFGFCGSLSFRRFFNPKSTLIETDFQVAGYRYMEAAAFAAAHLPIVKSLARGPGHAPV